MGWVRVAPNRLKWFDENKKPVKKPRLHHIQPDIQPYKAVAGDMAGKFITSRSQHRNYLKRHGYEEVGNDSGSIYREQRRDEQRRASSAIRAELARRFSR